MSRLTIKPTEWHVRPVKSEFSLSAWRNLGSLATIWAHGEDSDQTGQMPRLIWVFAGCTGHFVGFDMLPLIFSWQCVSLQVSFTAYELGHDKTNKMSVRPAKTQISLCICPVWSKSLLSAWRKLGPKLPIKCTAKILIRLGRCPGWSESSLGAQSLLVLSCGGSIIYYDLD